MNRDGDISVVITSHNEGLMINEALDSIERQTALHRIREVIIVDDGSDAETVDVLKHQAAIRPLVRLILQSNQGLPSARN
jgi:glycosyltransferase involved in cell wall biosynthesis